MNWRKLLSPSLPFAERKTKASNTNARADAIIEPITRLKDGIVSAGWRCVEEVKPWVRTNPNLVVNGHNLQTIYLFYEFLYVFMHLMNREAHGRLSPEQHSKLQQIIATMIIRPIAVDSFFGHCPERIKIGIASDFYKNLNNSEVGYSSFNKLVSDSGKNDLSNDKALFSKLSENVLDLVGYNIADMQEGTALEVLARIIRISAMRKLLDAPDKTVESATKSLSFGGLQNFGKLVKEAGAAIDIFEREVEFPLVDVIRESQTVGTVVIESRDYWFKIVEFLQQNWGERYT